jgi:uncharacterized protein
VKQILQKTIEKHSQNVLFAYLFGSHARGVEVESGDIDIAVFLNEPAVDFVFDVKIDLYLDLTRALKRNDIDLVMMNRCKNLMLLYGIISDGYVIFDGDPATRIDYEQRLLHQAIDFIGQRKMALGI